MDSTMRSRCVEGSMPIENASEGNSPGPTPEHHPPRVW